MGGSQNSGTTGVVGTTPGGGASGAGTGANSATPYNGAAGGGGLLIVGGNRNVALEFLSQAGVSEFLCVRLVRSHPPLGERL